LFSVEFDGIGGGYSSGGKYRQARATDDPHRQLKMDFKLRVSDRVGYPLVVVSFDELQALDGKESLTILDGIVAQFVTRREEDALFKELVDDHADTIGQLAGSECDEYMEDWCYRPASSLSLSTIRSLLLAWRLSRRQRVLISTAMAQNGCLIRRFPTYQAGRRLSRA
jgi:hypothetical protein